MSAPEQLGTLEELVLLTVCSLSDDAYGVSVHQHLADVSGRSVSLGAIHTTLYRLQDKGFLESEMGGSSPTRGGRRKRIFRATGAGIEVLRTTRSVRDRLWESIPSLGSSLRFS